MKEKIKDSLYYLVLVAGASYLGLIGMLLSSFPVRFITSSELVENVVMVVTAVAVSAAAVYIMVRRVGYQNTTDGFVSVSHEIPWFVLANILYTIINVIIHFRNPGVLHVVGVANVITLLRNGYTLDLVEVWTQLKGFLIVFSLIFGAINVVFMILGYLHGGKKRIADRESMTGRRSTNP